MPLTQTSESRPSTGQLPVLDVQQLLDRCLGSLELAERCLVRFLQKLPEEVECLRQYFECGDDGALAQAAHRLKGSAATVAAVSLSRAAAALERWARGDDTEDPQEVLSRLSQEAERLLDSAPQFSQLARPGDSR